MSPDARLLSPKSPDADLLSAAALAQQVGAAATAAELKELARQNMLAKRRASLPADSDPFAAIAGAMADPTWDEIF